MAEKAKKAKPKTKVMDCCVPADVGYKPTLYLDLEGQDVSQVKGLTVGEEGVFVVKGKIVGLEASERSHTNEDGKTENRKTGSIRLKEFRVEVMGEDDNEFGELSED